MSVAGLVVGVAGVTTESDRADVVMPLGPVARAAPARPDHLDERTTTDPPRRANPTVE